MSKDFKPLALTMGDPSSIAPEITAAAWHAHDEKNLPSFFVIGDPALYEDICPVQTIETPGQTQDIFEKALPVLPIALAQKAQPGALNPANTNAVLDSINRAVSFAQSGEARGIVTNPIHKAALQDSGFGFPGHTEYLAHLCGGNITPVMMLAAQDLRVVPLTIHMALADVPAALTKDKIIETAIIILKALKTDFGISNPCLAVAGLNPHAGESGAFGREEIDIISPAIQTLKNSGFNVNGPYSADTLFHEEARASYDAVLCMYHDQALIPLKTLDFHGGVNITLGLPIIRTSPDHGTALDIAGRGIARPDSLIAAIQKASDLSAHKNI